MTSKYGFEFSGREIYETINALIRQHIPFEVGEVRDTPCICVPSKERAVLELTILEKCGRMELKDNRNDRVWAHLNYANAVNQIKRLILGEEK